MTAELKTHHGNLTVTNENLSYAATVKRVTGPLYIRAEGASLPALTSVGGTLYIRAEGASLPALTSVGGWLDISAEGASLPALTSVGGPLYIRAEGASLPALTSVGGYLDIRAEGASLPELESTHWRGVKKRIDHIGLTGQFRIGDETLTVEYIDGISTVIDGWHERDGISLSKGSYLAVEDRQTCYIARSGSTYAHGHTIREAVTDLRTKLAEREGMQAAIERVREAGVVTREDYHVITGACSAGIAEFLARHGISEDQDSLPLAEVLRLTQGAYRGDVFAREVGEEA